jgi:glycosyltransferase involved in cell wall biosynthesis
MEFNCDSTVIAYGANIYNSRNAQKLSQLQLTKNNYYLVVGRLFPSNNIDYVVKTFIRFNHSKKLVIVGGQFFPDRYEKELKKHQSDQIIFTGFVNDQLFMSELYANAYCYIHGHECGGTNPSLLNALAHGCCIIALDTPFNREVLLDNRYGFYFQKEPDSLFDMISRIDRDPKTVRQYQEKSRERILDHYTWEKISGQYEQLLSKTISNSTIQSLNNTV